MFRIVGNTVRLRTNSQQIRLASKCLSSLCGLSCYGTSNLISNATCQLGVNVKYGLTRHIGLKVQFHTSPCRRALPPLLLLIKPFGKAAAIVVGRTTKRWWIKLPPEQREAIKQTIKQNKNKLYLAFTLLPLGFLLYYVTHQEVDPITGRTKFIAYSKEQVLQLAQLELDVQIELHRNNFLLPSHPSFKRVSNVTNRLLKSNSDLAQVQGQKWLVTVVDEPDVKNAFVLPTGHIFIFTGMLNECTNDDQLCVILAHEVSHVLLNHSAEQMSHLNFLDMVLMVPIALMWAILPDFAALITQSLSTYMTSLMFRLPFSRSLETEADQIGLQLTAKACYDVREASAFWARMSVHQSKQLEWLSTHPNSETRHTHLDELMPGAIKLREDCKCPHLPVLDPRNLIRNKYYQRSIYRGS